MTATMGIMRAGQSASVSRLCRVICRTPGRNHIRASKATTPSSPCASDPCVNLDYSTSQRVCGRTIRGRRCSRPARRPPSPRGPPASPCRRAPRRPTAPARQPAAAPPRLLQARRGRALLALQQQDRGLAQFKKALLATQNLRDFIEIRDQILLAVDHVQAKAMIRKVFGGNPLPVWIQLGLCDLDHKLELLADTGVDYTLVVEFPPEQAEVPAAIFDRQWLVDCLNA